MKKTTLLKWSVLSVASVGMFSAEAQITSPAVSLDAPVPQSRNRVGASFRGGFNAKVNFQGVGAFKPVAPTRKTPAGADFNYDDGYVLTDSSGNAGGFTRYWGYDDASQYVPANGQIIMHSSSSAGISTGASADEPLPGFELTFNRELGRSGMLRWGLEGAFNFLNVSVHDSRPLTIGYPRTSTPYQLPMDEGGFVTPPTAPFYHGPDFNPPGGQGNPVINFAPLPSATATAFATMTGARNFDANVFGFRLGPSLELSLAERWSLAFSGGLALAVVESDFSFNEAVALPNVPPVSGAGSKNDLLVGWYVAGNVNFQMTKAWGLFSGVQFQDLGKYSHTVNGRTAELDLGATVFFVVGASFSF